MKVKQIDRTANIAWSPQPQHPIYIAAGTAAQQLDATFSTNAALEIYQLNLGDPGVEMKPAGILSSDARFNKLAWGVHGMESSETPSGVLAGGCDNGNMYLWDPSKIMDGKEALIAKQEKHSGPVTALDFNPFQTNLLASGASDSEIFLWDMNNLSSPMTPGAKSQPPDDVSCVAWNRQVQHILASTFTSRCVVWDLRKNDPIIKISDSMSRIKSKLVAWHPDVATQMCLASEDDHTPVIQIWDLRFATSALKVLENHQRGVLSIAWCPQDPDLLLSCGKDNRILCWNPNSAVQGGEVIYELPTSNQWSFDVQWCPRNPAVLSSSAFDGHISIYSLMGGDEQPVTPRDKIAESFTDAFGQPIAHQQTGQTQTKMPLQKPPKWLRTPVGASFAFGGKLISFAHEKPSQNTQQQVPKQVFISQVVTETDLISRSSQLESALNNRQFAEFCAMKIANSKNEFEENIWNFMKVNFENDPRSHFLQLLGYDQNDLNKKIANATLESSEDVQGIDAGELAERMTALSTGKHGTQNLLPSGQQSPKVEDSKSPDMLGDSADGSAAFDKIAAETDSRSDSPFPISTNDDKDGLLSQALLTGNFEAAVELCFKDGRMAEAMILAVADSPELLARTQRRYFKQNKCNISRLISSVVQRDWSSIVETCEIDNWKEALAIILTYAKPEEFSTLCDTLGSRLELEKHGELATNAILCYICAGNIERLVDCWSRHTQNNTSPDTLQDLVEKVMILRKAVEAAQGHTVDITGGLLAEKLSRYSELLAAQGSLATAIAYLGNSNEITLVTLRDRLYQALGQAAAGYQKPPCPFQKQDVRAPTVANVSAPQQRQQQQTGAAKPYRQVQAVSTFQTVTTPTASSSNYYNPNQYSGYNGNVNTTPTYSQGATQFSYGQQNQPLTTQAGTATSRGPLASRYPAANVASAAYGFEGYSQPQSDYSHQGAYSQAGSYTSQHQQYGYGGPQNMMSQPTPSASIYNPGEQQQTPGAPVPQPVDTSSQPSYQEVKPEGAWNDPPLPSSASKKKAQQMEYVPQAPITQPIFGVPQPEQTPPEGAPYAQQQYYSPQQHQPIQQQQQQQQAPAQAPTPVSPKVKGPIPAENQVLQDILDSLVNKCLENPTNAQTKRKLEDVARRLETLYDKLRDSQLSPSVILGLHQIIQAIQQYDYQSGLNIHTQMVSQGNFSEISSFMPGIKVLLQTSWQMQVYIQ